MGEVLAVRNAYRTQNWFRVIQECRDSGLTNREFCRQRGIPEKKFYFDHLLDLTGGRADKEQAR